MAIQKFDKDVNVVSRIPDLPGSEGGLSTEQFKAKFDEAALLIQQYINEVLIPGIESSVDEEGLLNQISERIDEVRRLADDAMTAAGAAHDAADAAQSSADAAQNTADAALPKAGGDLTGATSAPALSIKNNSWPTLLFKNANGQNMGRVAIDTSSNRMMFGQQESGSGYYEGYQLPARTSGLTSSKFYEILTTKNVAYSTGSPSIDSTNVNKKNELTYYKYGRIVIARFDLEMKTAPSATFTSYQVATGFPKASGSQRAIALLHDLSVGAKQPVIATVTASGALQIESRSDAISGRAVIGSLIYIAES